MEFTDLTQEIIQFCGICYWLTRFKSRLKGKDIATLLTSVVKETYIELQLTLTK